jgi:hypothetical protein
MKKVILTLATMIAAVSGTYAQNGKVSLGVRATPDGGGFTGKFYATKNVAIELQLNGGGILTGEGQSFTTVGLVEYHFFMPNPSWQVYFGGGLHAGVWDHDSRNYWNGDNYINRTSSEAIFGMDAIAGVEYKFKKLPLSLSADMKPAVNFVQTPRFFSHNMMGVSARFHIR